METSMANLRALQRVVVMLVAASLVS